MIDLLAIAAHIKAAREVKTDIEKTELEPVTKKSTRRLAIQIASKIALDNDLKQDVKSLMNYKPQGCKCKSCKAVPQRMLDAILELL